LKKFYVLFTQSRFSNSRPRMRFGLLLTILFEFSRSSRFTLLIVDRGREVFVSFLSLLLNKNKHLTNFA
jgi:hypothetical protein